MRAPVAPDLSERRHDLRHGVPVPFASDPAAGYAARGSASEPADLGAVVKARAIQCALSRVCGLCGLSMSGTTTFVGSPAESDENTFAFPPMHPACVDFALATYPSLGVPVLGQPVVRDEWVVVETGGFELERPDLRGAPVLFHPNSVVATTVTTAG
ncbi:MAG: hypothetical protein HOQ22_00440 [Nocardioidaceae bacterium]|nr:hypothetical protein [Nocardioidaceae bacterium]NUS49496.1 hypothetical protein [Nocardioidaceae bacterium]